MLTAHGANVLTGLTVFTSGGTKGGQHLQRLSCNPPLRDVQSKTKQTGHTHALNALTCTNNACTDMSETH